MILWRNLKPATVLAVLNHLAQAKREAAAGVRPPERAAAAGKGGARGLPAAGATAKARASSL